MLDHTGLTGKYDFLLEVAPERRSAPQDGANAAAPSEPSGPGFAEALRQQLGLMLESQKGSTEVWIVDHVEHATGN